MPIILLSDFENKSIKMTKFIIGLFYLSILTNEGVSQCLNSEQEYKDYFLKNIQTLDPIEGLWDVNSSVTTILYGSRETNDNLHEGIDAIIKVGDNYKLCYMYDKAYSTILFTKTTVNEYYKFKKIWFLYPDRDYNGNAFLSKNNILSYNINLPVDEFGISTDIKHTYVKLFPLESDFIINSPSSGTGFGISNEGLIVTNHHVVDGAQKIFVRGVSGDFTKKYSAKIIIEDKTNDISIIKIDDPSFTGLGTIPYAIKNSQNDVGSSIFVLGYPLRATMGDEIKLTNGIISSKSGFQGDITSYQVSAPVQPGNSGGPLFDDKGDLIGIVNAKHAEAENVSYAIKIFYLNSLIESSSDKIQLPVVNSLLGKSLSDQVKVLKKFVYIIEVN